MDRVRNELWIPGDLPFDGSGVRIAVVDSGVDTEHPDLRDAVDWQRSEHLAWNASTIEDRCYHGTHIAGIIAGRGVASVDRKYRGIAPGATLLVYKVYEGQRGDASTVADAIGRAVDAGVDLINFSSGYSPAERVGPAPWVWPAATSAIELAVADATRNGILCVTAAGNDGDDEGSINRPGGMAEVLTVGALGFDGNVMPMSSRGPYRVLPSLKHGGERRYEPMLDRGVEERAKPDVVAPGDRIVGPRARCGVMVQQSDLLDPSDVACQYLYMAGTSQATAVATGLAALLLDAARRNDITLGPNPGQTLKRLMMHEMPKPASGSKFDYGAGRLSWINAYATLIDCTDNAALRARLILGEQLRLMP